MNKEEIIEFLKENLDIWVDTKIEFGPEKHLVVELELCGETIASQSTVID